MQIHFSHPQYLLLLPLAWAFTWWVLRGSLADLGRGRERGAALVRMGLLTCLVLALAGIQFIRPADALCTVFVVDVSDSISPDQRKIVLDYVQAAMQGMRKSDRAALVAFGAEALLDHAPEGAAAIRDIISTPTGSRTDIAAGIQLAMASFPQECGKQIILFSDGNENLGDALAQSSLAHASDVHISVVPLKRDVSRGEALLLQAEAPAEVKQGAPFQVNLVAESTEETEATINLLRNGEAIERRPVHLAVGKTVVAFEQALPAGGLYHFRAVMDVAQGHDTVPDNNVAYAYTRVTGKPRMLVVEGTAGDGAALAAALRANDLQVSLAGPDAIPASLAECAQYDGLVFANVPAWKMSPMQMALIRSAVRDTGMGFAMVGGEQSFGAGGYVHTPIEVALPVSMEPKRQQALPTLTLVIVIDCSGSMAENEDGVQKVRLASRAAQAAVELLQPIDNVSVMGFDTQPVPLVEMRRADDKPRIYGEIDKLQPGGGGILALPALEEAYRIVRTADTQVKHIILCADATDTETNPGEDKECVALARRMAQEQITLSVIGFGHPGDPHLPLHQEIAHAGGGNAYLAERMSSLPQVFTRDVMYAARSLLVEEPFRAQPKDGAHPAVRGVAFDTAPPLFGYVSTGMKESPTARELLASPKEDPLLAAWPFGLGRTLAFTSDATGHWGAAWLDWGGYTTFWAQALRWTLRQAGQANFQTTLSAHQGRATIQVEATTPAGDFRNQLDLRAHVAHVSAVGGEPRAVEEVLKLDQVAPGRYQAAFEARNTGTYVVTVEEHDGENVVGLQTVTMAVPYSPEFQQLQPNDALLAQVAARAQGVVDPAPGAVFGALRFDARVLRDLWPVLLLILGFLFLVDVALRRVLLPWGELAHLAWRAVRGRLPRLGPADTAPSTSRTVLVGGLLTAKERVRRPRPSAVPPVTRPPEDPPAPQEPAPPPKEPPSPIPSASPETTAGRLLQRKRARKP